MSLEVTILRAGVEVVTFKPDGNSNQQKQVMGDNVVNLTFTLNQIVNFNINDYAIIFGETYYLAKEPDVTKNSLYEYDYSMQMVSSQYSLSKAQMMFYDSSNELTEGEFSLTGTASVFMDLLVKNINRIDSGWTKGGVISTGTKTITFSKASCADALSQIAEAFDTEFYISAKTVHLSKIANQTPYKFRYGNSKGLYTITRKQVSDVVTRLYAFGADKNLPPDYPSSRLRLPGGYTFLAHNISWTVEDGNTTGDGLASISTISTSVMTFDYPTNDQIASVVVEHRIKGNSVLASNSTTSSPVRFLIAKDFINEVRLLSKDSLGNTLAVTPFFDVNGAVNAVPTDPIFLSDTALPYLEENTEIYGVIEANYINDDIYPHRTGLITSVDALDIYTFSDSTIDFDINAQLLPGLSPKITFNTGQLAGYTFEISHYDNTTKEITILKNKDETSIDIPSSLLKAAIGDEYVFTDIEMPISYVQAAEQELLAAAQAYIDQYSSPNYQYSIQCDPKYFRYRQIKMNLGDVVFISDSELQVEKNIRVVTLSKSLIDEYQYDLEVSDIVPKGTLQEIVSNQQATQSSVNSVTDSFNNNALLNGYLICPTAADTSAMNQLFVDANGKIWKGA